MVDLFLEAHKRAPREIVLDIDNTDITLYGMQEGRFFHGYYEDYSAICRSIYFAAGTFCWRVSVRPMSLAAPAPKSKWRASSRTSAGSGRRRASSCAATAAFSRFKLER